MSQDFKLQQNIKVGNDLINLRADNPDEFKSIAEWTITNAALFVNVAAALNAVPPALAPHIASVAVTNTPQQDAPAAALAQYAAGPAPWQQQQGQPPAFVPQQAPQQQAPTYSQPATQGPVCAHGPMVHRSGSKNGRDWSGHFCPTPKGTQGQCDPVFGK